MFKTIGNGLSKFCSKTDCLVSTFSTFWINVNLPFPFLTPKKEWNRPLKKKKKEWKRSIASKKVRKSLKHYPQCMFFVRTQPHDIVQWALMLKAKGTNARCHNGHPNYEASFMSVPVPRKVLLRDLDRETLQDPDHTLEIVLWFLPIRWQYVWYRKFI